MDNDSTFGFRRSRANSRSSSPSVEDEDKSSHIDDYLRELTSPAAPNIDIVAVHGLNRGTADHGELTWSKNTVLWLRDERFLPGRFPNARVLLFGYNSRVATGTSTAGVMDIAVALLNRLVMKRRDDPQRPIIFLCHSLGGIIVKQALVKSRNSSAYKSIRLSTRAIAFFGTPHRGGNGANLGRILSDIALVLTGNVKNNFMETLQKNSTIAADIHELFIGQAQDYQIVSFYETQPLKPLGLIVDKVSATFGLPDSAEIIVPVAANHSDICKFDRKDSTYEVVIDNIAKLVQHALQPLRIGTPLLTPTISLTDPYNNQQRLPSLLSFHSTESFDILDDSATSSSRSSLQSGMPTFEDEQPGNSHPTTATGIPPVQPVIILPYISNPDFIGRERIFNTIKESLSSTKSGQQRVALCGLGGVGKSAVATRYAYWYRQNFPDHSIFWIHCSTADRFRQGLIDVSAKCNVSGTADRNNNYRLLLLKDWLQRTTDFKWLMILDNADDPTIFRDAQDLSESNQNRFDLSSYIPVCEHGSILITTRDMKLGRRLANGRNPVQVNRLSQEEGVMMLKTRLSTRGGASPITPASPTSYQQSINDSDLIRLAQSLDYLPLAIVQAASFITENFMSIGRYEALFRNDSSAVKLLQHEIDERAQDSDIPSSLYATWELSIQQIQETNPKSAEMIFLMAHYEQLQIPASLLEHYASVDGVEFTTIISVLLRFSLVNKGSDGTYNMHRLVQLIVKGWLIASSAAEKWQSEALRVLSSHFPSGEYQTWGMCASLESHAVKMVHTAGMKGADKALLGALQIKLAWYYSTRGRWSSAEEHARAACDKLQEAHGLRHRETLAASIKLVHILKQNTKLNEAGLVITQTVNESRALLGSKNEQYFDALDVLALILQSQGKLVEAKRVSEKVLSRREKVLKPNHPSIPESQRRLATILEYSGNYNQAEDLIKAAWDGRKHLAGTADRSTLMIMQRLHFIQRAQAKYNEAEKTAAEFLKVSTATYGPTHILTQEARYTFASSLIDIGKIEEAETIFLFLINFIEKEHPFGPDHQYNFFIQNMLGRIRVIQGRYEEALRHQSTAWNGLQIAFGKHHAKTYESQSTYASTLILANASQIDLAIIQQQQAYDGLKKIVGEQHPTTLTALFRLSEAHATKQDIGHAMKLAEQTLKGREKKLNTNHPDVLAARKWIYELRTMQQGTTDSNTDPDKIDIGGLGKKQKNRRSYWGMGPRVSSKATTVEPGPYDDDDASAEKKTTTHETVEKLEKTSSQDSTKGKRKSSSRLFGKYLYGKTDGNIEDKEIETIENDSDDSDKGESSDLEKSAACTTNPFKRAGMPLRPAVESQSFTTSQDSDGQGFNHSSSKDDLSQTFPQEDATGSTLQQIRRKQVAPRPSTYPEENYPSSMQDVSELPAEVNENPTARLNGPGWDAYPFGE